MSAAEIVAIVTTIGMVASVIYNFMGSKRSLKNDIIDDYEKRLVQVEKHLEQVTKDLIETNTKLKVATEILQGRNPELEKFMDITMRMLADIHGAVMPQTVTKPK